MFHPISPQSPHLSHSYFSQAAASRDAAAAVFPSAAELLTKLQQLGSSYEAMQLFCSIDITDLAKFQQTFDLADFIKIFEDMYCRSCVMSHASKAYAEADLFDKSFLLISKIPMASETMKSCHFLNGKMIAKGLIEKCLEQITSLHNVGSVQQRVLENTALDDLVSYLQKNPSLQETYLKRILEHFTSQRSGRNFDDFWKKLFQFFLDSKQPKLAGQTLPMIYSIKTREMLIRSIAAFSP